MKLFVPQDFKAYGLKAWVRKEIKIVLQGATESASLILSPPPEIILLGLV
jgi:hypothetical protein